MESTTPLALYLEKLAAGERELAPLICQKLSQQLVYVPVCVGGKSKSDGKLVFQVVKLPEGSVPVFTTEQQYKEWATTSSEATEVFTVLGGDLCATVGERATVILDIGSSHSSILDFALMQLVASAAGETIIEERTLRMGGPPPPVAELAAPTPLTAEAVLAKPMFPTSDQVTTTEVTTTEVIESAIVKDSIEAPPAKKEHDSIDPLRGRSNPTSIMPRPTRPQVNFDRDVHSRNKLPSTSVRPVITTQDPDSAKLIRAKEDPKKGGRRSLLKFLGG